MICVTSPQPTIPTRIWSIRFLNFEKLILALHCAADGRVEHVLLDEQEHDKGRDHGERGRGHEVADIGAVLLHKHLDADGNGHGVFAGELFTDH